MTIRVLIVDDSALVRNVLKAVVNEQPDMQVVGMAPDAFVARDMVRELNPDVITLDVEMPKMDGLAFLQQLMQLKPTPVIMVSSHTEAGSDITFRALEIGAVDFVTKPRPGAAGGQDYGDLIAYKIRAAASARVTAREPRPPAAVPPRRKTAAKKAVDTPRVIFIGASTGGTHAIQEILQAMPADSPPVLIVQHMPESFSKPLASRLDAVCEITVKEAEDGEPILPGHAYIGPGDLHFLIRRTDAPKRYIAHLAQAQAVNLHRPSVDILFRSAAKRVGAGAVGVLLTGGGKDGAEGLLEIKQAGGRTIVQDEASCVVFGMPREAIALGAALEVVSLPSIAQRLRSGPEKGS